MQNAFMGRWLFAALAILACLVVGGCSAQDGSERDSQDQWNAMGAHEQYATAGIAAAAVVTDMAGGRERQHKPPPQSVATIQGYLIDSAGNSLANATVTIRRAGRFLANPDTLKAVPIPDNAGDFKIPVGKSGAICADISAPGCRPLRRWFIVAVPGVGKYLPQDQSQLIMVSPYIKTAAGVQIILKRDEN